MAKTKPVLQKNNSQILIVIIIVIVLAVLLSNKTIVNIFTGTNFTAVTGGEAVLLERQNYGIPMSVFEDLPILPKDFAESNYIPLGTDYTNFSEDYFLQPEFFPSFGENSLAYWRNPDPKRYVALGYGFFPGVQKIIVKKGTAINARFFMHSGFGVQSFQGMKVKVISGGENSNVEVKVLSDEFLLGPNFPKFSKNWAKAIDVKVFPNDSTETGLHVFRFGVEFPSTKSSEWRKIYGDNYFDASSAGASFFHEMQIEVVD
ncbi:MAG: hypothetical protein Q7K42_00150 [Candidatus Diapherotrites archaeon]|nr:hypothetical protein [Candidatus Diapherotrites archaeon]